MIVYQQQERIEYRETNRGIAGTCTNKREANIERQTGVLIGREPTTREKAIKTDNQGY